MTKETAVDEKIKRRIDALLSERSKRTLTQLFKMSEKQAAKYRFYLAFKERRDEVIMPAFNELAALLKDSDLNYEIIPGDIEVAMIFSESAIDKRERDRLPSIRLSPDLENFRVRVLGIGDGIPKEGYALDDVSKELVLTLTLDLLKRAFS